MHFFELFGLPVKSLCIVAGDNALYLKAGKDSFQFGPNIVSKKPDEYIIVDTGVPITKDFIEQMKKHGNVKAKKAFLRVRCIEAVSELLESIGYKPDSNIPSLYLRKVLNQREHTNGGNQTYASQE